MVSLVTPMEWILLGASLIGSPALGYIALRTIFGDAGKWSIWKRALGSCVIGVGWMASLIGTGFLSSNLEINSLHVGEFFALAGMGFIVLIGIISLFTRGVHAMLLNAPAIHASPAFPSSNNKPFSKPTTPSTPAREPSFRDVEVQDDNAFAERLSSSDKAKPARARSAFIPASVPSQEGPSFSGGWEPSMQDGLGFLKEEAAPQPTKARDKPIAPRAGISSLDAQLEQLKKDIKAFNASASKGVHAQE